MCVCEYFINLERKYIIFLRNGGASSHTLVFIILVIVCKDVSGYVRLPTDVAYGELEILG